MGKTENVIHLHSYRLRTKLSFLVFFLSAERVETLAKLVSRGQIPVTMPLRQAPHPALPPVHEPADLHPESEVFQIRFTGEVFGAYEYVRLSLPWLFSMD